MNAWRRLALVALPVIVGAPARADPAGAPRVLLLFSISKSENRNQVQYAVRVDDACQPTSGTPVFAYWRMFEKGPAVTEPLLAHEMDAYGVASQAPVRTPEGAGVRLILRAVRSRPIVVEAFRNAAGECEAVATVSIQGTPAHLYNVYAKLRWPFGVEYLLLQGWSLEGTRVIKEKVEAP
jgi:hypothetical protein